MDISMILGLALAGSIVIFNNKNQHKKQANSKSNPPEFVVHLRDDKAALSPKQG
ncbi:MAG: hypothetical protein AAGF93_04020 [Cyanobacteria bacterium P01_H01_bin.105]